MGTIGLYVNDLPILFQAPELIVDRISPFPDTLSQVLLDQGPVFLIGEHFCGQFVGDRLDLISEYPCQFGIYVFQQSVLDEIDPHAQFFGKTLKIDAQ